MTLSSSHKGGIPIATSPAQRLTTNFVRVQSLSAEDEGEDAAWFAWRQELMPWFYANYKMVSPFDLC